PVTYGSRGAAAETSTGPLTLAVTGVLPPGEATLRDIAGPVPVQATNWLLLYGAGGLALAAFAAALFIALRRRRRRRKLEVARKKAAAPRPAHEEALARLD